VAALTVVTLLFLTGLFENLPKATLAAVVIAAVVELIDFPALAALYRIATRQLRGIYGIAARPDFIAAVAALAGVLVFDTLPGLFIGVVVSLLLLVYRASRPHVAVLGRVPGVPGQYGDVARHPENLPEPGIALLRVEGGLFFKERVGEHREPIGPLKLYIDDQVVAEAEIRTVLGHFSLCGEGLCIGYDGGDRVSTSYPHRFEFTGGKIVKVVFDVADDAYIDVERHFAAAIARD
jgi:hypothetical protein